MKIELIVKKGFDVKTLLIDAKVRYWEDAKINGIEDENGDLIPCRVGDNWRPIIDIESGVVTNWEIGKEAIVHYKVADEGEYWLQDVQGVNIVKAKGCYVPNFLAIEGVGYGDYIIINIDKNGFIDNWKFDSDPFNCEDED